jgi:hypothetical protein
MHSLSNVFLVYPQKYNNLEDSTNNDSYNSGLKTNRKGSLINNKSNKSSIININESTKSKNEDEELTFTLVFRNKSRVYYVKNISEYYEWLEVLRKVLDYRDLSLIYDAKEKIGDGNYGEILLGMHKENKRKVAIKKFDKPKMTLQDLIMVKEELEIHKISQHPNLITLYDYYENEKEILIVMEYCEGGDLFSYLEIRNFTLKEQQTADLVFKLASAVHYLHSYGIVHRDIKPENILMTNTSDSADLKLMDFGFGKILGPEEEKICESFGTIVRIIINYIPLYITVILLSNLIVIYFT